MSCLFPSPTPPLQQSILLFKWDRRPRRPSGSEQTSDRRSRSEGWKEGREGGSEKGEGLFLREAEERLQCLSASPARYLKLPPSCSSPAFSLSLPPPRPFPRQPHKLPRSPLHTLILEHPIPPRPLPPSPQKPGSGVRQAYIHILATPHTGCTPIRVKQLHLPTQPPIYQITLTHGHNSHVQTHNPVCC